MKKILSVLLALVLMLAVSAALADDDTVTDTVTVKVELSYQYSMARDMITAINNFRTGADGKDVWYWNSDDETKTIVTGLEPLTYDYGLEKVAMQRAAECAVFYAHMRPNGKSCFTIYPSSGSGENIAAGYRTTAAVFDGWREENMPYSGQGHRRNMLSSYSTHIGIGCVYADGIYFWCQALGTAATGEGASSLSGPAKVEATITRLSSEGGMKNLTASCGEILKIKEGESAAVPSVDGNSPGWGRTQITVIDPPWTPADTSIVNVENGKIEALKGGKTTIRINIGSELTVNVVSICKEHTWNEGTVTLAPTCTETGTKHFVCTVCDEEKDEVIPALGHDWDEPFYQWGDGYAEMTATRICKRDHVHVETETVKSSSEILEAPTCTEKGLKEFTAAFRNEAFTAQSKKVDIDALGHDWDEGVITKKATYAEDGTILYTCKRCGEEEEQVYSIKIPLGQSGWVQKDGFWYYGNEDGNAVMGPYTVDGVMYYFTNEGKMVTGWMLLDGTWYYAQPSGALYHGGWTQLGSVWYYFRSTGEMVTGWLNDGGSTYYLAESGAMVTGWQLIDGDWYYLSSSGAMKTGWMQEGRTWYLLASDGKMVTGWGESGGRKYYFNGSGAMVTGWLKANNEWYYLESSGAMATGWQKIDNVWYWFDASGVMKTGWLQDGGVTYWFSPSGAMVTGWKQIDGTWYYFENSGAMKTGWLKDKDGTWYWFDSDGQMATGQQTIGGNEEMFASSGAWLYTVSGQ